MEIFAIVAAVILLWMVWQLYRAKQFNHFKRRIREELTPKVIEFIKLDLVENRSDVFPNNDYHIQAAVDYWTKSTARILQYALQKEIVTEKWLKETGNYRHCQHLFHIEGHYLHHFKESNEQ